MFPQIEFIKRERETVVVCASKELNDVVYKIITDTFKKAMDKENQKANS